MKYLTRGWATGKLTDDEWKERDKAYQHHLDELLPHLPKPVATIAADISLNDALIRKICLHTVEHWVILELLCGDQQYGYFDLSLTYTQVDFDLLDIEEFACIARDPRTEILYTEVDLVADGVYEHRILFSPHGEVTLRFRELEVQHKERADRICQRAKDPFVDEGRARHS